MLSVRQHFLSLDSGITSQLMSASRGQTVGDRSRDIEGSVVRERTRPLLGCTRPSTMLARLVTLIVPCPDRYQWRRRMACRSVHGRRWVARIVERDLPRCFTVPAAGFCAMGRQVPGAAEGSRAGGADRASGVQAARFSIRFAILNARVVRPAKQPRIPASSHAAQFS